MATKYGFIQSAPGFNQTVSGILTRPADRDQFFDQRLIRVPKGAILYHGTGMESGEVHSLAIRTDASSGLPAFRFKTKCPGVYLSPTLALNLKFDAGGVIAFMVLEDLYLLDLSISADQPNVGSYLFDPQIGTKKLENYSVPSKLFGARIFTPKFQETHTDGEPALRDLCKEAGVDGSINFDELDFLHPKPDVSKGVAEAFRTLKATHNDLVRLTQDRGLPFPLAGRAYPEVVLREPIAAKKILMVPHYRVPMEDTIHALRALNTMRMSDDDDNVEHSQVTSNKKAGVSGYYWGLMCRNQINAPYTAVYPAPWRLFTYLTTPQTAEARMGGALSRMTGREGVSPKMAAHIMGIRLPPASMKLDLAKPSHQVMFDAYSGTCGRCRTSTDDSITLGIDTHLEAYVDRLLKLNGTSTPLDATVKRGMRAVLKERPNCSHLLRKFNMGLKLQGVAGSAGNATM